MQVERTLVKSPPELWAEVSDVDALTRHLARLGEISITRVEPETTVAWEGERTRGTVELAPSGWGTKVTLTAEPAAPVEAVENGTPGVPESTAVGPPAEAVEHGTSGVRESTAPVLGVRWGRLRFWRREAEAPMPPGSPAPPSPPVPAPEPPDPTPSPGPPDPPDPSPPQIRVVLSDALDSLGQAHHRPFSR